MTQQEAIELTLVVIEHLRSQAEVLRGCYDEELQQRRPGSFSMGYGESAVRNDRDADALQFLVDQFVAPGIVL